jgi:hypothetical protein
MGKQEVTHVWRPVRCKDLKRLRIRQMPMSSPYAIFERPGITAIHEHVMVVIGFEEGCVALFKMVDEVVAGFPNISKYAYSFCC